MKKKGWIIAVLPAAALALTAVLLVRAGSSGEPAARLIPGQERIVSLSPGITEILFALGLDEQIVAVSSDSDYPPAATQRMKTGTFWQPDIESIIAARPTVVIAEDFPRQAQTARSLSNIGYDVRKIPLENLDDFRRAVAGLGELFDRPRHADEILSELRDKIAQISRPADCEPVPVLFVIQLEPLRAAGSDTFINELIELAQGVNVVGPTLQQYPQLGPEQLMASRAQVILHISMTGQDNHKQLAQARQFWKQKYPQVPAVANDAIYIIDSDLVTRLGPRVVRGLVQINDYVAGRYGPGGKDENDQQAAN